MLLARIIFFSFFCSDTSPSNLAANLVLQDTVERIYSGTYYAEDPVGLFLVRGENVLLLGEIVSCVPLLFQSSTDLSFQGSRYRR